MNRTSTVWLILSWALAGTIGAAIQDLVFDQPRTVKAQLNEWSATIDREAWERNYRDAMRELKQAREDEAQADGLEGQCKATLRERAR